MSDYTKGWWLCACRYLNPPEAERCEACAAVPSPAGEAPTRCPGCGSDSPTVRLRINALGSWAECCNVFHSTPASSPPAAAPDREGELLAAILDAPYRFDSLDDCTMSPEQKVKKAREIITALRARITEGDAERESLRRERDEAVEVARNTDGVKWRNYACRLRRRRNAALTWLAEARSRLSTLEGENARLTEAMEDLKALRADYTAPEEYVRAVRAKVDAALRVDPHGAAK